MSVSVLLDIHAIPWLIAERKLLKILPQFMQRCSDRLQTGVICICCVCYVTVKTLACMLIVLCSLFMAARQLAGRRPLYFTALLTFLSSYFLFFRRLISEVSGPIVTKLCHMCGGDCNF